MDSLTAGREAADFVADRSLRLREASRLLPGELIWLPHVGMGFFPCKNTLATYDDDYFEKYLGYEQTEQGRAITEARSRLVIKHIGHRRPLDFGIGSGAFLKHHGGWGYDIMPAARRWLLSLNMLVDPYIMGPPQGILTCWDSLEHVEAPEILLDTVSEWLFVSLPIFTSGEHARTSKHFRPTEHFWYWTDAGFRLWLAEQGFEVVEANDMEVALGREGIGTYAARRVRDALGQLHR